MRYGAVMRQVLFPLALGLAGCAGGPGSVRYVCTDGNLVSASYRPGEVVLALPNLRVVLPQVPAASGTRYRKAHLAWLTKGSEAILLDGGLSTGCRAVANR